MKIFAYETIKIFRKKYIIAALLIFSLINVYKINLYFKTDFNVNSRYSSSKEYNQGYWTAYDKASGVITDKKINFVINRYKNARAVVSTGSFSTKPNQPNTYTGYIFGDMNMFKELYDSLDYCYNYGNRLDNVIRKAQENIKFYGKRGNTYEAKNNEKIVKVYGGRTIDEFYNTGGYGEFFNYDFSSLLIILLLILGLASSFSLEKETGMNNILLTCRYGKSDTVFAKIKAAALFIIIISIYFFVLDFVCFSFIFRLLGKNLPLYAISDFQFTPLNVKIWQFVILSDFIKLFGFLTIGMIILFFSSIFSESLFSFVLSAGTITACIGSNDFLSGMTGKIISLINPISMLTNRELFKKYSVLNIFGEPVFQFTANLIIMLLFLLFIIFSIVLVNKKCNFISRRTPSHYLKKLKEEILNI